MLKHSGIETTIGPLVKEFLTLLALHLAEEILKKLGKDIINHKIPGNCRRWMPSWKVCHEAMSLAGDIVQL